VKVLVKGQKNEVKKQSNQPSTQLTQSNLTYYENL